MKLPDDARGELMLLAFLVAAGFFFTMGWTMARFSPVPDRYEFVGTSQGVLWRCNKLTGEAVSAIPGRVGGRWIAVEDDPLPPIP